MPLYIQLLSGSQRCRVAKVRSQPDSPHTTSDSGSGKLLLAFCCRYEPQTDDPPVSSFSAVRMVFENKPKLGTKLSLELMLHMFAQ